MFPTVHTLIRPEALRDGTIPMNRIIQHDMDMVPAKYYLQTHSTNPLLKSDTITAAIEAFYSGLPKCDSLFSVTRVYSRFWSAEGNPVNHDPKELIRTQDLPPYFEENSCIYMFTSESFQKNNHRLGDHPHMFEIEGSEALDIDEELDFLVVESVMEKQFR